MKNIFAFSILFIFSTVLFSQEENCWYQYSNGNSATALAEDGDYFWISLDNGLGKIDKTTFEIKELYNSSNSALPAYKTDEIILDQDGNVWV